MLRHKDRALCGKSVYGWCVWILYTARGDKRRMIRLPTPIHKKDRSQSHPLQKNMLRHKVHISYEKSVCRRCGFCTHIMELGGGRCDCSYLPFEYVCWGEIWRQDTILEGLGNSNFGATDISHLLSDSVCRREIWRQDIISEWWEIPALERLTSFISYLNLFEEERSEDTRSCRRYGKSQILVFVSWETMTQWIQIVCVDGVFGFYAHFKVTVERDLSSSRQLERRLISISFCSSKTL